MNSISSAVMSTGSFWLKPKAELKLRTKKATKRTEDRKQDEVPMVVIPGLRMAGATIFISLLMGDKPCADDAEVLIELRNDELRRAGRGRKTALLDGFAKRV